MKPSPRLGEDVIAWAPERSGIFSVRSAYRLALEVFHRPSSVAASRAPDRRRAIWALIWRCPAPPKVRIFAWRLTSNSLATWANKHARTLEPSDLCPIYAMEREETFHIFCRCPRAVSLWQAMAGHWNLPDIKRVWHKGEECLFDLMQDLGDYDRMRILMVLWRSWHVWNEIVHNKPPPLEEASRRFLLIYEESLLAIQEFPDADSVRGKMVINGDNRKAPLSHVGPVPQPPAGWLPLAEGRVKLNIDGSFIDSTGEAGAGMIL